MDIVNELLERAESQGYLAIEDVLDSLGTTEESKPLGSILGELRQAGVEIEAVDDEDDEDDAPDDDLEPSLDDIVNEEIEVWDEEMYDLDGIGVDDTVALYLREMARVPLLSNDAIT
jgi:hypothetical protein